MSDRNLTISVIVCTYNRAQILRDSLESFAGMRGSDQPNVELLIIDNNSTDATRRVSDEYCSQHPNARYALASQPGLSNARNKGVTEARGRIIAYVDDDVLFDPGWLEAVIDIFEKHPDASCMGGKSIPKFDAGRPDWACGEVLSIYGSTQSGDSVKWMTYPEHPFGLNMAFRRDVFSQVGEFNPRLGRKKKNLLSMEESDYFYRVAKAGLKVIYTPSAVLFHRIPQSRTSEQWALARYYWQGISAVAFKQIHQPLTRPQLLRELWRTSREILRLCTGGKILPREVYWHHVKRPMKSKIQLATAIGRIRGLLTEMFSF